MPRETTAASPTPRIPLARRLTVGAAGALGWSVLSLLLTLALPLLLLVFLFDRQRDHRLLGAFGSCCLRLFFVHFLGAIRYRRQF